ncbi:MAG TPA: hypothetical protein VJA19_22210 [Pseudomonas sp.]|nr:hypothetical protein [Pseudomonas sp.]
MQPEQKRVRQMSAMLRLRALQSEKSELLHAKRLKALQQSQAALRARQQDYAQVLGRYQTQQGAGLTVDPALHEQRLQGLLAMRAGVLEQETQVAEERRHYQTAKDALSEARVDERIANKAHQSAKDALSQYRNAQELIDIFDAQQAGGRSHGV